MNAADRFVRSLTDTSRDDAAAHIDVYLGVVSALSGGGATVEVIPQAIYGSDADSGQGHVTVARLAGPPLTAGNVVLMVREGREHYVLGLVGGDLAPLLLAGSGAAGTAARSDHYHNTEAGSGVFLKIDDDAPSAASNASTSTFTTLYSEAISLPSGTWSGDHLILATVKNNTAGQGATVRTGAPSPSGGTTVTDPTANAPFTLFDRGAVASVSGSVTFTAEYRASGGGTVTPQRWLRILLLRRVA